MATISEIATNKAGKRYVLATEGALNPGDKVGALYVQSVGAPVLRSDSWLYLCTCLLGARKPAASKVARRDNAEATQRMLDK